ncbi:hypothetical protein Hanom_Chr00s000003g01603651 [Helianthus anomalus]
MSLVRRRRWWCVENLTAASDNGGYGFITNPMFHSRIPFWSYAKLIITCWLVIPQFSGAAYVYQHYIRPFYVGNHTINVLYVLSKKDLFTDPTQDDIVVSADKYVREIGPDAFSGYGYVQESLPQETSELGLPAWQGPCSSSLV